MIVAAAGAPCLLRKQSTPGIACRRRADAAEEMGGSAAFFRHFCFGWIGL